MTYLGIKDGVSLGCIAPEGLRIISKVWHCYKLFDLVCVVTSVCDVATNRVEGSKHLIGEAVDFRTRDVPAATLKLVVRSIKLALGENYDVILETDHLHVEYDPKQGSLA